MEARPIGILVYLQLEKGVERGHQVMHLLQRYRPIDIDQNVIQLPTHQLYFDQEMGVWVDESHLELYAEYVLECINIQERTLLYKFPNLAQDLDRLDKLSLSGTQNYISQKGLDFVKTKTFRIGGQLFSATNSQIHLIIDLRDAEVFDAAVQRYSDALQKKTRTSESLAKDELPLSKTGASAEASGGGPSTLSRSGSLGKASAGGGGTSEDLTRVASGSDTSDLRRGGSAGSGGGSGASDLRRSGGGARGDTLRREVPPLQRPTSSLRCGSRFDEDEFRQNVLQVQHLTKSTQLEEHLGTHFGLRRQVGQEARPRGGGSHYHLVMDALNERGEPILRKYNMALNKDIGIGLRKQKMKDLIDILCHHPNPEWKRVAQAMAIEFL